jgi:predicted Zn-dependent peptidase
MRAPQRVTPVDDADTLVATLDNGVRVVVLRLPALATAAVSVFVRSGSQHESARSNGISHFIEHMAFKGTHTRDCQQINLDAERLGAEVNAHTDKNHTAFHMRGIARDAAAFVRMLGDNVRSSTFPEAELERERQVILHEYTDDEDDPVSTAFKLFDKACWGEHAAARPVIGTRANIRRFTRAELLARVEQHYTAANIVVGIAGPVDADAAVAEAAAAFGDVSRGTANVVAAPDYVGGIRTRRMSGCSQAQAVLGFPIPGLSGRYQSAVVAAALFGEGMSSPLLDTIRERRGLAYHVDCSADATDLCGQFIIDASTAPEHIDAYFVEVMRLLREHVEATDPVGLERARNQIMVRSLCAQESPVQRLELAALDIFAFDRVRSRRDLTEGIAAVSPRQVREAFARMLDAGPAVALSGRVPAGVPERVARLVGSVPD